MFHYWVKREKTKFFTVKVPFATHIPRYLVFEDPSGIIRRTDVWCFEISLLEKMLLIGKNCFIHTFKDNKPFGGYFCCLTGFYIILSSKEICIGSFAAFLFWELAFRTHLLVYFGKKLYCFVKKLYFKKRIKYKYKTSFFLLIRISLM